MTTPRWRATRDTADTNASGPSRHHARARSDVSGAPVRPCSRLNVVPPERGPSRRVALRVSTNRFGAACRADRHREELTVIDGDAERVQRLRDGKGCESERAGDAWR